MRGSGEVRQREDARSRDDEDVGGHHLHRSRSPPPPLSDVEGRELEGGRAARGDSRASQVSREGRAMS
eukprot:750733-Hanusia_phi.AAC.4